MRPDLWLQTWPCTSHSWSLHPQGRGGSTGYDNAVALPARADAEELLKENDKKTGALKGSAVFSVAKVREQGINADKTLQGLSCDGHLLMKHPPL